MAAPYCRGGSALPLALVLVQLAGCSLFRPSGQRPPYRKLSPPVAYEMIRDNPQMLVIDLRPPLEYNGETGHLRRARNIPLDGLPARLREISRFRDDTLLVYCGAGDCGDRGITLLKESGFENAILLDGGIDAWIRAGFKTVLPSTAAGQARPAADGRGPIRPVKPGELLEEVEVPSGPPPPRPVAAPRQIG